LLVLGGGGDKDITSVPDQLATLHAGVIFRLVQLIMKNYANWLDVKGTRQYVFPSAHRNAGRR
jgi:hypothetical protein